jgi:hypothetical protein
MGWFSSSHSRSSSHRPSASRAGSSFSRASSSRSSSYYKRRPRDGYVNRLIYKLKHLFRELYYYARRNPIKLFFLLVPLISGGVLAGVARKVGIQLPGFLQGKHGGRGGGGGGYYGSHGYEQEHDGGGLGGMASSLGGLSGLASSAGGIGGLMSVAKHFI